MQLRGRLPEAILDVHVGQSHGIAAVPQADETQSEACGESVAFPVGCYGRPGAGHSLAGGGFSIV
jgi:hypothetical protein